jgi:hypothetical protein
MVTSSDTQLTTFQFGQLIDETKALPDSWKVVPVSGKRVLLKDWTNNLKTPVEVVDYLYQAQSGHKWFSKTTGVALVLGDASGGVLAIDCDGQSSGDWLKAQFPEILANTRDWVMTSSNKPGHYQALFQVPVSLSGFLRAKEFTKYVVKTSTGDDGKDEAVEFRYNGTASNLPPSIHPET